MVLGIISVGFVVIGIVGGMFSPYACLLMGIFALIFGIIAAVIGNQARNDIKAQPHIYGGKVQVLVGNIGAGISIGLAVGEVIATFFFMGMYG